MFTGIIEDIGKIKSIRRGRGYLELEIESVLICEDVKIDDSVAVNGICLTVVAENSPIFQVQAVAETEKRTSLGFWKSGMSVNLERALRADARLGGHVVQGHVDCIAKIKKIKDLGENREFIFELPEEVLPYTVEKGSITVDGVSLTIAKKNRQEITLSLIPHSMKKTLFNMYKIGDSVNIETDILGKYIVEIVKTSGKGIDKETLMNWGYKI